MKTNFFVYSILAFLICFLGLSLSSQAQIYKPPIKRAQIRKIPAYQLRKPKLLRADLIMVESMQQYQQNGVRFIAVKVKNKGNLQAGASTLELRMSWRIDYEHWTTVERFKNFSIPQLAPGAQYTIHYAIPDHEIRTNEGFGSNSISFRFFADRRKNILESDEYNNVHVYYVPVLRD